MSWDLDEAEARELAEEHLRSFVQPSNGDEWVVVKVEGREWGWIMAWAARRAVEGSRAPEDTYAGGGPLLIDKATARVAMCGSAQDPDYYLDLWRRGELRDLPRPKG